MAINLQNYRENKARSGYGACLMFIDPFATDNDKTKYRLFIPLENVPSIDGSVDSFEFDLLNSPVKGKVAGKRALDDKDVEFLWHRDNVMRLEKYEDTVLNFMVVYADFTAKKFTGTISVRPNDVSNDVARGTFTITPMCVEKQTIYDCRSDIVPTVSFTTAIPDSISIKKTDTTGISITVRCDPSGATVEVSLTGGSAAFVDASYSNGVLSIKAKEGASAGFALVKLTATMNKYAAWEQTVAVELTA